MSPTSPIGDSSNNTEDYIRQMAYEDLIAMEVIMLSSNNTTVNNSIAEYIVENLRPNMGVSVKKHQRIRQSIESNCVKTEDKSTGAFRRLLLSESNADGRQLINQFNHLADTINCLSPSIEYQQKASDHLYSNLYNV